MSSIDLQKVSNQSEIVASKQDPKSISEQIDTNKSISEIIPNLDISLKNNTDEEQIVFHTSHLLNLVGATEPLLEMLSEKVPELSPTIDGLLKCMQKHIDALTDIYENEDIKTCPECEEIGNAIRKTEDDWEQSEIETDFSNQNVRSETTSLKEVIAYNTHHLTNLVEAADPMLKSFCDLVPESTSSINDLLRCLRKHINYLKELLPEEVIIEDEIYCVQDLPECVTLASAIDKIYTNPGISFVVNQTTHNGPYKVGQLIKKIDFQ